MPDRAPASTARAEYAAGLRRFADFIDTHPYLTRLPHDLVFVRVQSREEMVAWLDAMTDKALSIEGTTARVEGDCAGVRVMVTGCGWWVLAQPSPQPAPWLLKASA